LTSIRTNLLALLVALLATQYVRAQAVDYARDVLPILSENCYHCHGPDAKQRKASLRLDTKEGAFRTKDGVTVVVPKKPSESELVRRITSKDPDDQMPPPEDIRKLKPNQIETLKRWVEQGATWGTHWAFVPPVMPKIPGDADKRNPIDALVRAKLREAKLSPAPEADKVTLIRRVSLDLTGLPPTPGEVDTFVADTSPDAYEKLIDRLLASPRYGERMATKWLDLARYADTHGYQMDRYRATWPWRDWVIKAFNENLPFDQFVTWQMAGDLLPGATKEQRLATAFNRLHMQNEEGGIVEEEFRVAYVVDRVTTVGTAFLGLTFDCSRCHDHKFDPITQKDFYSLFAMFQNIDESGQTPTFVNPQPVPAMLLTDDAQERKLGELRAAVATKAKDLAAAREASQDAFKQWLSGKGDAPPAKIEGEAFAYGFEDEAPKKIEKGDKSQRVKLAGSGDPVELVPGRVGKAAHLDGENGFAVLNFETFTRADPFTMALWLKTPALAPRMTVLHKSRAPIDAASRGYELLLEDGRVAVGLHHMWPGNSLKVVTKQPISVNQWTHVAATYDGSSKAAGVHIYINGAPAELEVVRDGLFRDITYGDEPALSIGQRFRDNGFKGGFVDELKMYRRALTPLEVSRAMGGDALDLAWKASPDALAPAQRDGLFEYFAANVYPPTRDAAKALAAARKAENEFSTALPELMVMRELPTPKPAHILKRGAYDAPGEEVTANTPAFLPPFPKDAPHNRLGFAKWLLDPGNPLMARVTVNRAWQQMFGRGIVETSDNFGTQGSQPTNQPLLDYLARAYVDEMHWDTKRLLKTIALSATYRQSSKASPEQIAADPDDALLARGPARRLTAEMLRDQALAVSGLLVEKLGGPSVKPYQPAGIWDVAMGKPVYDQDKGEGLYRRSLYTFWKRTVPPPVMIAFDAADRSNCAVRRQSTSTPLQALALLNDPQITEAARFVSQRMLTEGGSTPGDRVAYAFRLITGRKANDREMTILKQMYADQHDLFANDPAAAAKLLKVGEKRNDDKFDRADLAAGTVLGIALFNHDAAVMRR
jgi:mono/diheme cytochrome c family protein